MPQGYLFTLFHFKMSEPVKYFQNDYICVGFGCAMTGTGICSSCSVLICILKLCRTVLFTWSCWCSCVCWRDVIPGANPESSWQGWHSQEEYTGVVRKGRLVEYIGSNVNTFYYCGMSRTMKMWLLYNYHSVGIQLFYFVICGYETQKMPCNQMVNM